MRDQRMYYSINCVGSANPSRLRECSAQVTIRRLSHRINMTLPPSIPITFLILGALAIGASELARLQGNQHVQRLVMPSLQQPDVLAHQEDHDDGVQSTGQLGCGESREEREGGSETLEPGLATRLGPQAASD